MEAVKIAVAECSKGDVLADDVYSHNGAILVTKGTILNDYVKMRLKEFGIDKVTIYNSFMENGDCHSAFRTVYKESILLVKDLLKDIASGHLNVHRMVCIITDHVHSNIGQNDHILRCLHEIRSTDEYTYTHCLNTALYSMLIGKWLELSENRIQDIVSAGLLHDVGKIKIPDKILNKKGKLSAEEFEVMKKHPVYGYELIKDIPELNISVKNAVLAHHERIDGTGYPHGLSGESIGLYAKIVAIADVYDAMTQNRVYKERVTPFDAFQMFLVEGVRGFDTTIMNTFLKHLSPLYVGSKVLLSNGQMGEIVYVPPHDIVNPILSVNEEYIDLARNRNLKVISVA